MQPQSQRVTNLLVPAFGNTQVLTITLPGASGYTANLTGYNIDDTPFATQSVTVNASLVPSGETVLFRVPRLNWERIVVGGRIETFTVPGIADFECSAVPSDGISPVTLYLYNFPMFPDVGGLANAAQVVTVNNPVKAAGVVYSGTLLKDTGGISANVIAPPGVGLRIMVHSFSISTVGDTFSAASFLQVRGASTGRTLGGVLVKTTGSEINEQFAFPTPMILSDNEALGLNADPATTQSVGPGVHVTVQYEIV